MTKNEHLHAYLSQFNVVLPADASVHPEPGKFWCKDELAAIRAALVSRGKRKGAWLRRAPAFRSPGYLAWQAKEMALTPRMPSEFIILLNEEEKDLFWRIERKLAFCATTKERARMALREIQGEE